MSDYRDITDTAKFVSDLCDIGVIDRGDRMLLVSMMNGPEAILPQAVTQAVASFLVNQRKDDIAPTSRGRYIAASARTQHQRLIGEEPDVSGGS